METSSFYETMKLTFTLAALTTLILTTIGIPLAYWLSSTHNRFKSIIEALVAMPLVLPPSVLGFYLLIAFSPHSFIGEFFQDSLGISLAFSFTGLLIGSVIFSLPFMVHPIQAGFNSLPPSLKEASYTLGKSPLTTFFHILLPNIKPSLLSGIVISFAHTIGEFGVVLMIGGNIPHQTRVASIAIYDEVESLNYALAHQYALTLFIVSFTILLTVFMINKRFLKANL